MTDWEALRSDSTFADGAELSPHVGVVWQVARTLPGWFTIDDCGHFALVLELQAALGVRGDLLEIGVYHGRSACVLAHHLGDREQLVLCDPFDACGGAYPEQSSPDRVRAALAPLLRGDLEVHHCRTADLRLAPERRFRFIHVDGDHTRAGALADLRLCARHLAPGGVMAVDDYHHRDFPEVTPAVDAFLAEAPELRVMADLNRHGAVGRKLYLVRR
jgi:cephalosporin hydroxylase